MSKAVNLPDIIRNDTDNMLRTQPCDSGVILFVPTPDHTCFGERPHPMNTRPGTVWQCGICDRMWQRTRNKWDGHSDGPDGRHSKKFYWKPITERKATKLAKMVLDSFNNAQQKKLELDAANSYRKHEAMAKVLPQLTSGLKSMNDKDPYAEKEDPYVEIDSDVADAEIMTPVEIMRAERRQELEKLMRQQCAMGPDEEFTTSQRKTIEAAVAKTIFKSG